MRCRAALVGLLGAFVAVAGLRAPAIIAGLVGVGSFLSTAWGTGGYAPAIGRLVVADLVALAAIAVAAVAVWLR